MFRLLPTPIYAPDVEEEEEQVVQVAQSSQSAPSQSIILRTPAPPYGQRVGWKPSTQEDYGEWLLVTLSADDTETY